MKRITGCILIGGRSSRMGGGIKSLKHFNNKSILDKIIERSIKQVSCLAINSNKNTEQEINLRSVASGYLYQQSDYFEAKNVKIVE